ncbi:AtaL-like protein [Parachitinimonas caeni]|uniref:DUF1857 family protein n=1 Tax=Parachitinimonas caeni TaxID=3031301 RepID=A0ABT7DZP3_9NEIS|nr:AtaL-like protein [Parachitinimonas caeni]MDK2124553.1 DUF1857 family protein [Parachitinimonas caeni]
MRFEHLIAINDPNNPLIESMSVTQLWRGLLQFTEQPMLFNDNLDKAIITERGEGYLQRELWFGDMQVKERVSFEPSKYLRFDTHASEQHSGGVKTVTIEVPAEGHLYLRFVYETPLKEAPEGQSGEIGPGADDAYFAGYVKEAYRSADIDTVRRIRMLFDLGQLGE